MEDRFHAFVMPEPARGRRRTVISAVLATLGIAAIATAVVNRQPPPPALPAALGSVVEAPPTSGGSVVMPTQTGQPAAPATPTPEESVPILAAVLPESNPMAIAIPAIGVRSRLLSVGQGRDGGIAMPPAGPNYDTAAWYRHSPTPGALGPAIVVGHVDSAADGPSVFYRLGELRPGDRIVIRRADGTTAAFRVDGIRMFRKDRFPTELVYGNTDHAALRLVTCGGPFDSSSGHYLDNIVVFASLESSRSA